MKLAIATTLFVLCSMATALASDRVVGEAMIFISPNGVSEKCVAIAPMPDARYSDGDRKDEIEFCSIDLYAENVALCPKTWSTSAGMMIYDVSKGAYAGRRDDFERNVCTEGKSAKDYADDTLAKFKPTMNAKGTSATFSTSSLLYYHFSRYFETVVKVPVAVWRSMDRKAHLEEVAQRGLSISGHSHSSRMNHEAWALLVAADQDPNRYSPVDELFTSDRSQIYGAMVTSPGHRYNSEINGTRKSGWGKGQNLDFQETAPFLALRSDKPLTDAIAEGVAQARKDAQIKRDMGEVSDQQMAFWMRELSEIVLLDYIFSQQDRVGNIDFRSYWYWNEGGKLNYQRAGHHEGDNPPVEGAIRLKRTYLNDNDAGGRIPYANFSKATGMLEKLRHLSTTTYRKLMALDRDLQAAGRLHSYVSESFGLTDKQVKQIVKNTALAADILRTSCRAGALRFDLEPEAFFLEGAVSERPADCEG